MTRPSKSNLGPRSLEAQLDHLLTSRWVAAGWAQPVWMVAELPPRLQQCVRRLARGTVWRAYTDEKQVYFVIGRVPTAHKRPGSHATLEAYFLDCDATLLAGGFWSYDTAHGFQLDEEVDSGDTASTPAPALNLSMKTELAAVFGRGRPLLA